MRKRRSGYRMGVSVLVAVCFVALEVVLALGRWHQLAPTARGMRLVSHGDYVPAVRELAKTVALRPHDAQAHYYLGLAYAGIGQRQASLSHLQEAVHLKPADARFHDALGRAYRGVGDAFHAISEFEQAVRSSPKTSRYEVDLAGLLIDQGRWPEAVAHLRRLERDEPTAPGVRLLLADVLKQAGDRDRMEHEYRAVIRLADGTALGELARQGLQSAAHVSGP